MKLEKEIFIHLAKNRKRSGQSFLTETPFLQIAENILSPKQSIFLNAVQPQYNKAFLLTYIGDLGLHDSTVLEENNVFNFDSAVLVKNPYPEDAILFFDIRLSEYFFSEVQSQPIQEANNNFNFLSSQVLLGQFENRFEGDFSIKTSPSKKSFIHVLNGIIEIEERLLEKGDSLSLHKFEKITFESFSEDCVLLFFLF